MDLGVLPCMLILLFVFLFAANPEHDKRLRLGGCNGAPEEGCFSSVVDGSAVSDRSYREDSHGCSR